MTYEIKNLDSLETSTSDLSSINEKIKRNSESLQYIIDQIKLNWENEAGQDLASILKELEECATKLNDAVVPVVSKYVTTMATLAAESRSTQSNAL